MYRQQLRFVLRFGSHAQLDELVKRLHVAETERGWAPPRIWHAVTGRVNEIVIEHDYADVDAYRRERAAFFAEPGEAGTILRELTELTVPGTAEQQDLDEL